MMCTLVIKLKQNRGLTKKKNKLIILIISYILSLNPQKEICKNTKKNKKTSRNKRGGSKCMR